jgi:hypothetical protein
MAGPAVTGHVPSAIATEISPEEVFAGGEVTLTVSVTCEHGCDLSGLVVELADETGAAIAPPVELARIEEGVNYSAPVVLRVPTTVGVQHVIATFAAQEKAGERHEEAKSSASYVVKPHTISLIAWDVPSAVPAGDSFRISLGLKCTANACRLAGERFEVRDHLGTVQATGTLADEPRRGTVAVYPAGVELVAPGSAGQYRWEVVVGDFGREMPHAGGSTSFGLRVVDAPEVTVEIEVLERSSQRPVPGAQVSLHPFRAVTDDRGVARIAVTKGEYQLFVSGFNFVTQREALEVTADRRLRFELEVEPEPSGDEHY